MAVFSVYVQSIPTFFFQICLYGALSSNFPEVYVGNDIWPSDGEDGSQASVDKGLQLVGVGLNIVTSFSGTYTSINSDYKIYTNIY